MQQHQHQQQQRKTLLRRKKRRSDGGLCVGTNPVFVPLLGPFFLVMLVGALALLYELHRALSSSSATTRTTRTTTRTTPPRSEPPKPPRVPILPIFSPVPDADYWIRQTLSEGRPTLAGVTAVLQGYVHELHLLNRRLSASRAPADQILDQTVRLAARHTGRLDTAYRGRLLFDVRNDESVFVSLAAYREHLLAETLYSAFDKAAAPEKLYVGAVVQNCFGAVLVHDDGNDNDHDVRLTIDATGLPCRTGRVVVGKTKDGKDKTRVSDAPPDKNGIAEFCGNPAYAGYCDAGQIRVLWVHETESLGPAFARYMASKLWGGETYFMQMDAHLEFAADWDDKYRAEFRATASHPKSVLSSYPPGFDDFSDAAVPETHGRRLCNCGTGVKEANPVVKIASGTSYGGHEPRPTQIPFIAAGFFWTRAEFLRDVPFDPYLFWLFMGEEIALSMRAWTAGWNIYAPRRNIIRHQYRPGRLGLPKFWGTVDRLFGKGGVNNSKLQRPVLRRIKHIVGYPGSATDKIVADGLQLVLTDVEHYGLGTARSWQDYMEFSCMKLDVDTDVMECGVNEWCNKGLKE